MKTQSQPTIYSFSPKVKISVISVSGSPWFNASEVCRAIGIANHRDAVRKLDDDEKGVGSTDTLGGEQETIIISESGLYTLILRCRDAVTPGTIPYRFRKWVTSEVLPSIRQTGQYVQKQQPETLGDLAGTGGSTMSVRDARRGKSQTSSKAAERIAEACVPLILKEMSEQYHYANAEVGPAEVIPALLSDKGQLQLRALMGELADNGHDVSGAYRELEAIRHHVKQLTSRWNDVASHAQYILQQAKG
ncbi:BRO family protein [Erwinia aphidicola]|uniref:BRO-N domain-containing protein n=1 Tax=Erwinia aphidicola TaxID=68334 RepID=UPI0030CEF342